MATEVTVTIDILWNNCWAVFLLRWLSMPMDLLLLITLICGLFYCWKGDHFQNSCFFSVIKNKKKEDIHFLSFYYSINETVSSINKKMDGTRFKSYINHFHIQLYVSCDHISGDKGHVISTKWIIIKIKPGQNPHITWY